MPVNSMSPRNRPRFNGRDRISVVIRGIRIPATMLCFGGAVPSDPPGLPSHEVSLAGAIGRPPPQPAGGKIIKRKMLKYYSAVGRPPTDRIGLSWDIALSEKEAAGYFHGVVLLHRG